MARPDRVNTAGSIILMTKSAKVVCPFLGKMISTFKYFGINLMAELSTFLLQNHCMFVPNNNDNCVSISILL